MYHDLPLPPPMPTGGPPLPRDRQTPAQRPTSPDCSVGKCRACPGTAWDHTADAPTDCTCGCHRPD